MDLTFQVCPEVWSFHLRVIDFLQGGKACHCKARLHPVTPRVIAAACVVFLTFTDKVY